MKTINEDITSDLKKSKLADYLGVEEGEIEEFDESHFGVEDAEYLVCDEDNAYELAGDDIQNSFEDLGLDAFTSNFREFILNNCLDDDWLDEIVREELYEFYSDIDDVSQVELDNIVDQKMEDIGNPIDWLEDTYGDEFINDLIQSHSEAVDMNKVIEECIDEDGIAHFIAYYDGKEIELGDGLFAYRQN